MADWHQHEFFGACVFVFLLFLQERKVALNIITYVRTVVTHFLWFPILLSYNIRGPGSVKHRDDRCIDEESSRVPSYEHCSEQSENIIGR